MKLFGSMLAVACVALLVVPGLPQDRPFSANKVMKGCSAFVAKTKWEREGSQDDAFLSGICIGVVSTLADLEQKATGVCKPEEVTGEQQVRVVAYIDARPNRLHEDFRALTWEALRDAWPCR